MSAISFPKSQLSILQICSDPLFLYHCWYNNYDVILAITASYTPCTMYHAFHRICITVCVVLKKVDTFWWLFVVGAVTFVLFLIEVYIASLFYRLLDCPFIFRAKVARKTHSIIR